MPTLGSEETLRAVKAATRSLANWRNLLPHDRADILHRWYELILEIRESLAVLMTTEQGKPLADARADFENAFARDWPIFVEALVEHSEHDGLVRKKDKS